MCSAWCAVFAVCRAQSARLQGRRYASPCPFPCSQMCCCCQRYRVRDQPRLFGQGGTPRGVVPHGTPHESCIGVPASLPKMTRSPTTPPTFHPQFSRTGVGVRVQCGVRSRSVRSVQCLQSARCMARTVVHLQSASRNLCRAPICLSVGGLGFICNMRSIQCIER